ncbi:kinase-like domain-containing protein [Mycena pura]|uniref:Kinase-like domain-containing protein n=1 Tax=Mycena pura TaxID=153505 RepID=A0AAD6VHR9_9AGAR|nr:kinase-like domain-containing protein [Mycena pura]
MPLLPGDDPLARLNVGEEYWRNLHEWLKTRDSGYDLRPRFRPGWVPSWHKDPRKLSMLCEDAWRPFNSTVIDAVRLSDKAKVELKRIDTTVHPNEVEIATYFTYLGRTRKNHSVPILEVLHPPDDPNTTILVMPLLRRYDSPRFDTIGEAVDFFRQIFEGLQFMHNRNVAHRDCNSNNIMMDGQRLYPRGFHPDITHQDLMPDRYAKAGHRTRTRVPVKYYFIDFGISRRYSANERSGNLMEPIINGGDKSPPEHLQPGRVAADPFPTDIYYLGNLIRTDFLHVRGGFDFMEPLVKEMVRDDPTKRPTIDEVVDRFEVIRKNLTSGKLRSRVVGKNEFPYLPHRVVAHGFCRLRSILLRIPALPEAPE